MYKVAVLFSNFSETFAHISTKMSCNFVPIIKYAFRNLYPSYIQLNSYSNSYKSFRKISSKVVGGIETEISKNFRKTNPEDKTPKPGHWKVVAYATASNYNLRALKEALIKQGVYVPTELPSTEPSQGATYNSLYALAKYKVSSEDRCLFYFQEGAVVMWNFDELEQLTVLNFIEPFACHTYRKTVVKAESENMSYTYSPVSKRSYINDGVIHIATESAERAVVSLDMYTFSNSMALSVKLGIFEATLEEYIQGIEFLTEDLKHGNKIRISRREVLRKSGELFALRHSINLSTDLLDTPDFYWERDNLEVLYQLACTYFNISRRTKVLNEKLNHCIELMELVSSHLNDRHHVRLEWMIIVLIMVEVAFEFVHYYKTLF